MLHGFNNKKIHTAQYLIFQYHDNCEVQEISQSATFLFDAFHLFVQYVGTFVSQDGRMDRIM